MTTILLVSDINSAIHDELRSPLNKIIFPLNFSVEKQLQTMGIKITQPDDFLNDDDYQLIDETAINIGESWWDDQEMMKALSYNGINLGTTIKHELISTLLKIIHRIVLIDRILKNTKPELVVITNSNNLVDNVAPYICKIHGYKTKIFTTNKNKQSAFRFDTLRISIDFLGKNLVFRMPRSTFLAVKKCYELFWDLIFIFCKSHTKKQEFKKRILLLEFNLINWFYLLKHLSETQYELLLLNNRRPVIWNTESLNRAKKLRFTKLSLKKYNQNNKKKSQFLNNLRRVLEENPTLSSKFCVNSIMFWDFIKEDFIQFCLKRLMEIIDVVDSSQSLLEKEKINLVVSWDDNQQIERSIISVAKNKKIPTLQVQHGILNQIKTKNRSWSNFTLREIISDKYAVYGKLAYTMFANHGADTNKIIIAGCPRYDELFHSKIKNEKMILVTLSGIPSTAYSFFFSNKIISHYEKLFEAVFTSLAKIKDRKIIIKRHPSQDEILSIDRLTRQHVPSATIVTNAPTNDLLARADVVITPPSSIALEAMIVGKPVVLIKYLADDYGIPYVQHGAVIPIQSPHEAEKAIFDAVYDENTRKHLAEGRKKFVEEALSYHGNSCERIVEIIENLLSK